MASVNKVILVGHLGIDPEMRTTSSGDPVCTLSVATSMRIKNRNGEIRTNTEWHKVVLFRRLAEIANQFLKKGSIAYFEGQLKTRKWTDKAGIDRYTTEIEANELYLLEGRKQELEVTERSTIKKDKGGSINAMSPQNFVGDDSDIPF